MGQGSVPLGVGAAGAAGVGFGLWMATAEPNFAAGLGIPYYTAGHANSNLGSTKPLTLGTIWGVPFMVGRAVTIQRMAAWVTVVGAAGSLFRFGIYDASESTNGPVNRIADSGDHIGTALGRKETVGVGLALVAGRLYWAAITAGVSAPTVLAMTGSTIPGEVLIGKDRANLDTTVNFIIRSDGQLWADRLPAVWPAGGGSRTAENNTWPAVFLSA